MHQLMEQQLHLHPIPWQDTRWKTDYPSATSDDVGKLMAKFDSLEYSIGKMSVVNPRHRQQKYKPEVTPPASKGWSI